MNISFQNKFHRNFQEINFTYINNTGNIQGNSFILSLKYTSTKDVNISKIQTVLDLIQNKLVLINGISLMDAFSTGTPEKLKSYKDVCVIDFISLGLYPNEFDIGEIVSLWLEDKLVNIIPEIIAIECILDSNIGNIIPGTKQIGSFNHVDANLNGYKSWIEVEVDDAYSEKCTDCQNAYNLLVNLANDLNQSIFIDKNDTRIVSNTKDNLFVKCRWYITCIFPKNMYNIIYIDSQNQDVASYFGEKYRETLLLGHIKTLYISSGLMAGSFYTLSF